jgi:hypothetical protein
MNNPTNAFFFEIQQISEDSPLFDEFKNQQIFFSYFLIDQKYYLFFYGQKSIDIDLIDPFIDIIEELDTKERKIRSLRGFFLYVLEIMNNGKDLEILTTNLKTSFWRNLRTILRQNKKTVLLQFLFGRASSYQPSSSHLEDQIQTLQNQVNSLQHRIRDLETTLENSKYALSRTLKDPDDTKIIQQGDSTLKSGNEDSSIPNDNDRKVREVEHINSDILSDDSRINKKGIFKDQQYNLSSNKEKGLNESNFITLSNITEEEKIEIIQTGFQLQNEGKISLKKYYESTDPDSLFQWKGYSIKYETIRKDMSFQNFINN